MQQVNISSAWVCGVVHPQAPHFTLNPLCTALQSAQISLTGHTAFQCISQSFQFLSSSNLLTVYFMPSSRPCKQSTIANAHPCVFHTVHSHGTGYVYTHASQPPAQCLCNANVAYSVPGPGFAAIQKLSFHSLLSQVPKKLHNSWMDKIRFKTKEGGEKIN